VLRRVFELRREELIGSWRKLHNVLFAKYCYNGQVRGDEMSRECGTNGEERNAYRLLAGKPGGTRQL
jgi:predicted  nucleic acid-binding Zn ribbon protein